MSVKYYVRYSWVSKTEPTRDYGTYTGIISEYNLDIKRWWDSVISDKRYYWTLEGINSL